jgi:pimeloyl-ACP methyl ester carboxylesterase
MAEAGETSGSFEHQGCSLSYKVAGGAGPPVVFIQGVGVHGSGWTPQIEMLRSRYRCVVFDNRGIGASQPVGGALSVERMAGDTVAVMSHLGLASAHLVGHSLGGPIALEVALAEPRRVRSLSLLCTVARGSDATRMSGKMLWLGMRSRVGSRAARRRAFLEMVMPPGTLQRDDAQALAARLAPIFGHDLADQPPIVMKQLAALRAYDASARLAGIVDKPTLVVSAVHDPIAPPRFGRALANGIPGARYLEIENASHGLPIHRADVVNTLLDEHLAAAEARWAAAPGR